jgi:hypothetical protein
VNAVVPVGSVASADPVVFLRPQPVEKISESSNTTIDTRFMFPQKQCQ